MVDRRTEAFVVFKMFRYTNGYVALRSERQINEGVTFVLVNFEDNILVVLKFRLGKKGGP